MALICFCLVVHSGSWSPACLSVLCCKIKMSWWESENIRFCHLIEIDQTKPAHRQRVLTFSVSLCLSLRVKWFFTWRCLISCRTCFTEHETKAGIQEENLISGLLFCACRVIIFSPCRLKSADKGGFSVQCFSDASGGQQNTHTHRKGKDGWSVVVVCMCVCVCFCAPMMFESRFSFVLSLWRLLLPSQWIQLKISALSGFMNPMNNLLPPSSHVLLCKCSNTKF